MVSVPPNLGQALAPALPLPHRGPAPALPHSGCQVVVLQERLNVVQQALSHSNTNPNITLSSSLVLVNQLQLANPSPNPHL